MGTRQANIMEWFYGKLNELTPNYYSIQSNSLPSGSLSIFNRPMHEYDVDNNGDQNGDDSLQLLGDWMETMQDGLTIGTYISIAKVS